jgi:hypothetical protein
LRQHPEALGSVIEVFKGLESEAADELKAAMARPAPARQITCEAVEVAA